jgi:2-isopropylmalate synthase
VYTSFSGSHQDAIKKGFAALGTDYEEWGVPYLPIDPKHVGRTYEAVIRVNSQSGTGGVAYIMQEEHGLDLPRRLQVEFSKTIQTITEDTGTVIEPTDIWVTFTGEYLPEDAPVQLLSHEITTSDHGSSVTAQMLVDGEHATVTGQGGGPIAAFVAALQADVGVDVDVVDYSEHAVSAGSDATAVAYVETQNADGVVKWGVGMHESILTASLRAVVSAVNRQRADTELVERHEY